MKIQTINELEKEMRASARGKKPSPEDVALPSMEPATKPLEIYTEEQIAEFSSQDEAIGQILKERGYIKAQQ